MTRYLFLLLAFFYYLTFVSCNTTTPEKYFGLAVLNANMQFGFADDGLLRQFESPSAKMDEKTGQPVAMPRSEVLNEKLFVTAGFSQQALRNQMLFRETPTNKRAYNFSNPHCKSKCSQY